MAHCKAAAGPIGLMISSLPTPPRVSQRGHPKQSPGSIVNRRNWRQASQTIDRTSRPRSLTVVAAASDWDDNWQSNGKGGSIVKQRVAELLEGIDDKNVETSPPDYAEQTIIPADAPHPYEDLQVGERWREIQGANNWDGLLNPLDSVLRGELTRYGEFAQATYDAFDHDTFSGFCGSCKFRRENFFDRVYLKNRGYEITSYIYATAEAGLRFFKKPAAKVDENWTKDSNWIGYVAVCTSPEEIKRLGRRDIVIAWRGTVTQFEWFENTRVSLCPTGDNPFRKGSGAPAGISTGDLKVETGFLSMYESSNEESKFNKHSARQQVWLAVTKLVEKYKDEELSITLSGHSLGGALATLCAYDLAESGLNQRSSRSENKGEEEGGLGDVPITVYTFGCPRLGNNGFRDRMNELNVKVLRVENKHDLVPQVPGLFVNGDSPKFFQGLPNFLQSFFLIKLAEKFIEKLPGTYSHVGAEIQVDNLQSKWLRATKNPVETHNLEGYLHLIDGHSAGGFSVDVCRRDVALVNKASSLLHSEKFSFPSNWWQDANKGLVRDSSGHFQPRGRDPKDFPQLPVNDNLSATLR